ncbi:MAG TPA: FAD-dependent oxidoreductase [Roseiflexaceae bacterium]|nr:FAD-dependent oxidoreductase [Roseiflexaceae bacterium]
MTSAEIVICGAGIAGVAVAYELAVRRGVRDVLLVDERPPLSLTSDKSTECYRNFWPGPGDAMVALMDRSIDMLERLAGETDNRIHLNRRGYLYASSAPDGPERLRAAAEEAVALGAGPLRVHDGRLGAPAYAPAPHEGYAGQPAGADLILDSALIRQHFPFLDDAVTALLHTRRAGWFSAQQLGMVLLERARAAGVRLRNARLISIEQTNGRVTGVRLADGAATERVATETFVNAAGPLLREVGLMAGADLPIFCELHAKAAFNDLQGAVPRGAPMLICADPVALPWSAEERADLAETEETRALLEPLPAGAHLRPEGGLDSTTLLLLWNYHAGPTAPVFPPPLDPLLPEIALRGLATLVPGLRAYIGRMPRPYLDGGYYTRTPENRPLVGPLPTQGAFVLGALSGYGVMAACAAAELLADHILGNTLPHYAPALHPDRYADPTYQALLDDWGETGQL